MTTQTKRAVVLGGVTSGPANKESERLALVREDGSSALATRLVTTATAIGTAAKTTTSAEPEANSLVAIKFTNGNSASSPTVAFAGGSARAIQLSGAASTGAELALAANSVALFFFDGTILHQVGAYT